MGAEPSRPDAGASCASAACRILVRAPNWLGDLAMSTPGLRALRAGFPDAHVAVHVRPELAPLLAGAPWIDEVLPLRSYHAGAGAMLREAADLRRHRFDLGLCIPDSFSSALLLRAAGVRRVVGYAGRGRTFLLHEPVSPPAAWGRRRMVSRERFVLGLVAALGHPCPDTRLELFVTPAEEADGQRILAERGVDPRAPIVALAPGASYGPSKQWPLESFAWVGSAARELGAQLLVLGSPREVALAEELAGRVGAGAVCLAGVLDVGVLKAVIRRCRVLVANDVGVRHVAVAFRVPCVILFGPTSVEKTDENLAGVRVLETDVSCRPCYQRVCPIDHRCMKRLEPERAVRAMRELLSGRGLPPALDGGAQTGEAPGA